MTQETQVRKSRFRGEKWGDLTPTQRVVGISALLLLTLGCCALTKYAADEGGKIQATKTAEAALWTATPPLPTTVAQTTDAPPAEEPTAVESPGPTTAEETTESEATTAPEPTTPPEPTEAAEPTRTPKPDLGEWQVGIETNPLDDSKTVILYLDADSRVKNWLGSSLPALLLQCKSGNTLAGFRLGTQAAVEGIYNKHTIQVRLDKDPAEKIQAGEGSESEMLIVPNGRSFAESLLGHQMLTFGFTPFESSPQVTTFQLTGIDEAIKPLREACGW